MVRTTARPEIGTRETTPEIPPAPSRKIRPRAIVVGLLLAVLLAGAAGGMTLLMRAGDTPTSPAQVEGGYTGDWKDGYVTREPVEPTAPYTGDWKDGIGGNVPSGSDSTYTGDWKDSVGAG